MAAKLRIYQGAVQSVARGVTKLRIYQGAVQVLWVDEIYWGADFISVSSIECDLTVGEPITAPPGDPAFARWTWPVTESLGFNTEILQSHNRTEQRIAKRQGVPEQHFGTSLIVEGENDFAKLESVFHTWLKKTWRVPIWPEAEIYSGILPSGTATISIDTRYARFAALGEALIWKDRENYEFVTIDSLTDSSLTLASATAGDYWGETFVMPVLLGRCVAAAGPRRYKGGAIVPVAWRLTDAEAASGFVADMTYDGYTVLTEPAYMSGDSEDAVHDPDVAVLDAGTGPFEVISNSDFNEVTQPYVWQPQTKEAAWKLRQFLCDVKGRQAAFLVPTFHRDLTLTRPMGAAETPLYVRNAMLTDMDVNTLRTYVAFRPAGGGIIVRKVMGISLVSDAEERIVIDASPEQAFGPGDHLCWVDKCRLASDTVEFEWYGRGKLTCETPLIRVAN